MIDWLFYLVMAPFNWAVTQTVVFAVTAPYSHVYIAMGISVFIVALLIWSMVPRRQQVEEPINLLIPAMPYEATEEDEQEAREILIRARAI